MVIFQNFHFFRRRKRKNIREYTLEKKSQDAFGEKVWYFYERFKRVETETLSVRKRKLFVIVRLRHNRFKFVLDVS